MGPCIRVQGYFITENNEGFKELVSILPEQGQYIPHIYTHWCQISHSTTFILPNSDAGRHLEFKERESRVRDGERSWKSAVFMEKSTLFREGEGEKKETKRFPSVWWLLFLLSLQIFHSLHHFFSSFFVSLHKEHSLYSTLFVESVSWKTKTVTKT